MIMKGGNHILSTGVIQLKTSVNNNRHK